MKTKQNNSCNIRSRNFMSLIIVMISAVIIFMQAKDYCQPVFTVHDNSGNNYLYIHSNGDVAIDTSSASGSLTVGGNNGIIATGTYGSGVQLSLGSGARMMWYPRKAAFRAGFINGTQWDNANIGDYSTAFGQNSTASGINSTAFGALCSAGNYESTAFGDGSSASGVISTAIGYYANATNLYSIAMGNGTIASGTASTATGDSTTAGGYASFASGFRSSSSGIYSTAEGYEATASGVYSIALGENATANTANTTAIGYKTTASGINSTALGDRTTASGNYSTALGFAATASGNYSFALGPNVSTNGKTGSVVISDASGFYPNSPAVSTADNQMMMSFAGGYILYSNSGLSAGVTLGSGQNSWSTVSDSTKKYAFLPVNGESVLRKISKFNLRSWSYKGQDSTRFRHYGPMAQEFHAAFGRDKYGVEGNDTTINQADLMGINLIAIQALEKENKKEDAEIRSQSAEVSRLGNELKVQRNEIVSEQTQIKKLEKMRIEFSRFKKAMASFINKSNASSKTKIAMGAN